MTALSIGELTGIPRETVRRKVKTLIDGGYLAISPKDKNIYLPASTITSDEVVEIFGFHVRDVGQLVRSVSYYQRD
jgi:DNA-binding IclR family transcriptional regulator